MVRPKFMKNVRKVHWVHDEILLNECRYRKTNESWSGPLLRWEAFIEINMKYFLGWKWKFGDHSVCGK